MLMSKAKVIMINALIAKTSMDERLAAIVVEPIKYRGFRLVRLRFMTGGKTPTLQIMAERPDGTMEVEDCAQLSRALSAILDVEDPIEGEYNLELSSPGIDRPLTTPDDFVNWMGYDAKIEMAHMVENRKRFRGVLKGFAQNCAIIDGIEFGTIHLPFDEIIDAKLVLTDELIRESLRRGTVSKDIGDDVEQDYEDNTHSEKEDTL